MDLLHKHDPHTATDTATVTVTVTALLTENTLTVILGKACMG